MVNAVAISVERPGPARLRPISCSSTRATIAAAPPPTPLNRATSCGIWVICTRYAPSDADRGSDGDGDQDRQQMMQVAAETKTITQASTAPAAPIRLPRRAVLGEDRPLSARMKQTAATR